MSTGRGIGSKIRIKAFSIIAGGIDIGSSLIRSLQEDPLLATFPSVISYLTNLSLIELLASVFFMALTVYLFTGSLSFDPEFQRACAAVAGLIYYFVQLDRSTTGLILVLAVLLFLYRQIAFDTSQNWRAEIGNAALDVYLVVLVSYAFAAVDPFLLILEIGFLSAVLLRLGSAGSLYRRIEGTEKRILDFTRRASESPYGIMMALLVYSQILLVATFLEPMISFKMIGMLVSFDTVFEIAVNIIHLRPSIPLAKLLGFALGASVITISSSCLLYWFTKIPYLTNYLEYVTGAKDEPYPTVDGVSLNLIYWIPLFGCLIIIAPGLSLHNAQVINGQIILYDKVKGQVVPFLLSPIILAGFLTIWATSVYTLIRSFTNLKSGHVSLTTTEISNLKSVPWSLGKASVLQIVLLWMYGLAMKLSVMYTAGYLGVILFSFLSIHIHRTVIPEEKRALGFVVLLTPLPLYYIVDDLVRVGEPLLIAPLAVFLNTGLAIDLMLDTRVFRN